MLLCGRRIYRSVNIKSTLFHRKSSTSPNDIKSNQSIVDQCLAVRSTLQSINDRCKGPLEKSSQKNTGFCFVFIY